MNNNKGASMNGKTMVKLATRVVCPGCERVFDLTNPDDADEVAYGHDCEDV